MLRGRLLDATAEQKLLAQVRQDARRHRLNGAHGKAAVKQPPQQTNIEKRSAREKAARQDAYHHRADTPAQEGRGGCAAVVTSGGGGRGASLTGGGRGGRRGSPAGGAFGVELNLRDAFGAPDSADGGAAMFLDKLIVTANGSAAISRPVTVHN